MAAGKEKSPFPQGRACAHVPVAGLKEPVPMLWWLAAQARTAALMGLCGFK